MRTGPSFREEHVLRNGERVILRHIRPSDAEELRRGYAELSPESRYRRFFGGAATLDDATVKYLTNVDGHDHVAIVAGMESLDLKNERGVGVARFVRLKEPKDAAEIAVTVVDDMQHKGLGTLLVSTAVVAAIERGIKAFRGEVMSDNVPIMTLLDEVGATRVSSPDGTVVFEIKLVDDIEPVLRRLLRAAATQVAAFMRKLTPPTEPHA